MYIPSIIQWRFRRRKGSDNERNKLGCAFAENWLLAMEYRHITKNSAKIWARASGHDDRQTGEGRISERLCLRTLWQTGGLGLLVLMQRRKAADWTCLKMEESWGRMRPGQKEIEI